MSDHPDPSPINALPPIVVALALAIFGVEAVLTLAARGYVGGPEGIGWRSAAIQDYGFYDSAFEWMRETGRYPAEHVMRAVTYPFIHFGFSHALFAVVLTLALGKMVGEVMGWFAVAAIWLAASIGGALAYGVFQDNPIPLVGAYPPAYGLIGGFTFLLWMNLAGTGNSRYRAFLLIGFLVAIQLIFGLLFGGNHDWLADIVGFGAGFGLSFLVAPGGWAAFLDRMRQR